MKTMAGVVFDRGGNVEDLAVELHRQGGAGEAGTDCLGHRGARHRRVELAFGAVGQGNGRHGSLVLIIAEAVSMAKVGVCCKGWVPARDAEVVFRGGGVMGAVLSPLGRIGDDREPHAEYRATPR